MAAAAATLPLVPEASTAGKASWVICVGGMAMLPDLDQGSVSWNRRRRTLLPGLTGSTVALMWGLPSVLLACAVQRLARGHRVGTHDPLLAPLIFGALAGVLSWWVWGRIVVLAFAFGLGLRALAIAMPGHQRVSAIVNLAISWIGAWWLVERLGSPAWIPVAVALGVAVHIAGDALTTGGIPAPLSWFDGRPRMIAGSRMSTGSRSERWLIGPALTVATIWLLYTAPIAAAAGSHP